MRQVSSDFGASKRSAGPNSHSFFQSSRVKSSEKRLINPYRQHAYFHAAVKRVALAISSVPFRIFVETGDAEQLSFRTRKEAYKNLGRVFPKLKMDVFDLFHDKGENVRKKLRREFAKTIQKLAPGAPLATVAKSVGLEVVDDGAWFDLFADVNPLMTRSQLWEALVIYLQTDGDCFWIPLDENGGFWEPPEQPVTGPQQDAHVPHELFVFGQKGFKPKVNAETKMLEAWEWRDPRKNLMSFTAGKPIILKPEQVIHFRFFDPDDFFGGLSPFQALDIELRQDHNASRYNAAFFEKGAQLSGWLSFDEGLTRTQRQDLEEQFRRDHQGIENAWQPGMLEGRAKWNQSGITQRDMQFFTLREWVRDEILAVVGTPKSEMGIFQDVNRASAQVSRRVFWENTNVPIMNYVEDLLFSDLFQPVNDGTVFGMFDLTQVEALREDLSDKAQVANEFFKIGIPLNDINERLELGFTDYAWGNVAWLSQNLNPVGSDPTLEPPPVETPPPGDDEPPTPPPGDDSEDEPGGDGNNPPPEPEDEESDGGTEESKPAMRPPPGLTFVGEYTRGQKEERWREIITRVMDPGEKKIKKTVRALTVRMRAASLAAIGDHASPDGSMRSVTNVEEVLFHADQFRIQLHDSIKPIYAEIFEAAAVEAEEELVEVGIVPLKDYSPVRLRQSIGEFDIVAEQLIESQADRVEKIVDTVRGILSDSMDSALAGGANEEDLKGIVRDRFKMFSGSFWLNRTARTESSLSTNAARDLIFRRRQVPSNIWLNVGDDRVRDTHVTIDDGIPRPIGFNFGKLIGGGIMLEFPLDPRAPAEETILCRCVLLPSQSPPVESPNKFESLSPLEILGLGPEEYPRLLEDEANQTLDWFSVEGKWTPERRELHGAIMETQLEGIPNAGDEGPWVTVLGGGPASGKTSTKGESDLLPPNPLDVNVDDLRELFPEWAGWLDAEDPNAAAMNHEEASWLAKQLLAEGRRKNIILDGTGDSSLEKLRAKVLGFRTRGAKKVVGLYVTADTDEAVRRMIARGEETGRFVPEDYMREVHAKISEVLPEAIAEGLFDEVQLWDTNVPKGSKPILIMTAVGSHITIVNQRLWERFLAKADVPETAD